MYTSFYILYTPYINISCKDSLFICEKFKIITYFRLLFKRQTKKNHMRFLISQKNFIYIKKIQIYDFNLIIHKVFIYLLKDLILFIFKSIFKEFLLFLLKEIIECNFTKKKSLF